MCCICNLSNYKSDFQHVQPNCRRPVEGAAVLSFPLSNHVSLQSDFCGVAQLWDQVQGGWQKVAAGAGGVFWQLELVTTDHLFCQLFLVSSCRVCPGAITRDKNVDFAVLSQITNLSANLFVFICGSLLLQRILWNKYIYLQAFLTLILPFLKFRMHRSGCKKHTSARWSQFWDILSTSGEQTSSLFPYKH